MKITTFDPMILTSKPNDVISVFEALGFEKTHTPFVSTGKADVLATRMENPDHFHVDVSDIQQLPQDQIFIRMNVDNYDEAYRILTEHGFKNTRGDGSVDTSSYKAAVMVSPSGFSIALVQHIKK